MLFGPWQGLSLFGFDVLYPTGSDTPTVVDVNYFPGICLPVAPHALAAIALTVCSFYDTTAYDGIPEFYPFLLDLLEKRRRRSRPSP